MTRFCSSVHQYFAIAASSAVSVPSLSAATQWSTKVWPMSTSVGHLGQSELRRLELADRLAERLALAGSTRASNRGAARAWATPVAAMLRRSWGRLLHEAEEALALAAEQVLGGHPHVGEEQLGRVLAVQPDLVEVATALEALHAPLHHEQRDALVALGRIGLGGHDHEVGVDAVGDEGLRRRSPRRCRRRGSPSSSSTPGRIPCPARSWPPR